MKKQHKLSQRQEHILAFMERYIGANGFPPTIREIGEATGIDSTSVVNYNLNKLVKLGYIQRTATKSRGLRLVNPQDNGNQPVRTVPAVLLPLSGYIVAGEPLAIPDDIGHNPDYDNAVEVPPSLLGGLDPAEVFAVRVNGDSMIDAMIQEGDVVILRKAETARNGDMVAVYLEGKGETTLKYFYREGENRIRLQPAHPTMDPIYVTADECRIQGRVLSIMRMM